ncbi:MAG: methionyl-tRNA formyltransferase [Bacteroidales bacterium]
MEQHKNLRIVYMGTPDFAVEPLRALCGNGYNVVAVVTAADKPAGRGRKLKSSPVKQFAANNNIRALQPANLKEEGFVNELKSLNADIFVVVAFRMLPKVVWQIPRLGTFNLHASLLPQYRGAAPINWAIINGEEKTGVTTFLIDEKIDTGSILLKQEVEIFPNETAGELHDRLMQIGASVVVRTVEILLEGAKPIPQSKLLGNDEELKPAPKLFRENLRINWSAPALEVHNFIRGLSPYPAAWTEIVDDSENAILVKIFRSSVVSENLQDKTEGTILTDSKNYIHVVCGKGIISIDELQLAGKRRLPTREFLVGFNGLATYHFV